MKYILFPPIRPPSPPLRQLLIIIMKFPNLSRHKHLRSGEERRKKCSLPKFIVYKNLALPSSVDYIVCSFCSGHFLLEKAQIKICTATLLHPVTYTLHNTTRQTQIWMFILCSFYLLSCPKHTHKHSSFLSSQQESHKTHDSNIFIKTSDKT